MNFGSMTQQLTNPNSPVGGMMWMPEGQSLSEKHNYPKPRAVVETPKPELNLLSSPEASAAGTVVVLLFLPVFAIALAALIWKGYRR